MKASPALLSLGLLLSAGCGYTKEITLRHTVPADVPRETRTPCSALEVAVEDDRPEIAALPAKNRQVIGYDRNGLGEHTIPTYLSKVPVETIVKEAMLEELTARGFLCPGEPGPTVRVRVLELFHDFENRLLGFATYSKADVTLEVAVLLPEGETRYLRTIDAHAKKLESLFGFDSHAALVRESLTKALDDALATLFADLAFRLAL